MLTFPAATSLDVTVSGHWADPAPNATWRGKAQAAEPLVALLFLRDRKSTRLNSSHRL